MAEALREALGFAADEPVPLVLVGRRADQRRVGALAARKPAARCRPLSTGEAATPAGLRGSALCAAPSPASARLSGVEVEARSPMPEFKRRDFLKAGAVSVAAAGASFAAPAQSPAISRAQLVKLRLGLRPRRCPTASIRARSPIMAPTPMRRAAKWSWRPRPRATSCRTTAWASPFTFRAISDRRACPARRSNARSRT